MPVGFLLPAKVILTACHNFEEDAPENLRFKIHASYISAHCGINQVVDALLLVKTPKPLHS